jgi:opacity protein-like surface antigen
MVNIKLIIIILLTPVLAQAQVSIVNALPDIEQSKGWNGELSLLASWRDDNNKDTKLTLGAAASINYRDKLWLVHFVTKGSYESENNNDTECSVMEHVRLRLSVGNLIEPLVVLMLVASGKKANRSGWYDAIYLETFAQHEYDKFRALNARVLWGIGPTFKLISVRTLHLMFGTAYMFEHIDFLGSVKTEFNHRWSNYIQISIIPSDRFSINSVTFAQFKLDNFSDYLFMSTISMKVRATERFGIEFGAGIEYDKKPPPGIKNIGTNISSNIFLEF